MITEMQIREQWDFLLIELSKNKNNDILHCWEGCPKWVHIQQKTIQTLIMTKIYIYWSRKMFTDFPFPLANSQLFINSQNKYTFPHAFPGHIPSQYLLLILVIHHNLIISVPAWWCPSLGSSESRAWDKDLGAGVLFGRWSKDIGRSEWRTVRERRRKN